MQSYELIEPFQNSLILDSFATDMQHHEACKSTCTVAIVSPYPAHIQELVCGLATNCYDLLIFHQFNTQQLTRFTADALIIDMMFSTTDIDKLIPKIVATGLPCIYLVSENTFSSIEKQLIQGEIVFWGRKGLSEVIHRVNKLILSKERPTGTDVKINFKDLQMDLKRIAVFRNSSRIDLTKTEFDLLKTIITSNGAVLTRQEILNSVWGLNYYGGSNVVDAHIKSLRQKLNDDPKNPCYILTVRGIGYRLAD